MTLVERTPFKKTGIGPILRQVVYSVNNVAQIFSALLTNSGELSFNPNEIWNAVSTGQTGNIFQSSPLLSRLKMNLLDELP